METYYGMVKSPADAIKLFEACRLGLLPRVQRRLSEKERHAIRSGSVFVWDEREAGMRRWTDGKSWSASRVAGSFLTYREMEGKRGNGFGSGGGGGRRQAGRTPDSGRGSDEDPEPEGPDGYKYKTDGLMKQSFSITTSNDQHLHLISYYSRASGDLPSPQTDPQLRNVIPAKGMYPESSLNEPSGPPLTRAPMQQPPYGHQRQVQGRPQPEYPPQYTQPGYGWPLSPVATPPYSNGHYQPGPPYPQATLPPPSQNHYAQGPPQPYSHGSLQGHFERLPPPQSTPTHQPRVGMPLPQPHPQQIHPQYQQHSQNTDQAQQSQHAPPPHNTSHLSQQRMAPLDSPRSQHLQAAARQAVMIDPQLAAANAARGPLPSLGQPQQNRQHTVSPESRARSISPGRNSEVRSTNGTSVASSKASLSALLHPTSSDPNGQTPGGNSAGSSPRAPTMGATNGANINHQVMRAERPAMEARAIGALDTKFRF
ncbi:Gti1/Pac2 family-domain-containing protein [Apodospora peruviana]|uniref:Gti1/Pac2 family-domain-containing protein n=1 Tax=Apodospora peruviana TaxID=516989 RepID=A0AAE0IAP7_9PEZI|nr:Gti1/Pac2 family-domain-containing protein [Apodospora peruviana]